MTSIDTIDNQVLKEKVKELVSTYPASLSVIEELIEHYDRDIKRRKTSLSSSSPTSSPDIVHITGFNFPSASEKPRVLAVTQTHLLIRDSKSKSIDAQYDLKTLTTGVCVPDPDMSHSYVFIIFRENDNDDAIIFSTSGDVMINRQDDTDIVAGDKHDTISELLEETTRVKFIQPAELKSNVKTYLKGRKGYLFFLPIGIMFGFSKPVLFFPLESLDSISIENVILNTFDLAITLKPKKTVIGTSNTDFMPNIDSEKITVAFSMVDRSEYDFINQYITEHHIVNRSSPKELMEIQMNKNVTPRSVSTKDDENENEEVLEDFNLSDEGENPLDLNSDEEAEMEADKELQLEELHEFEDAEVDGDD